MKPLVKSRKEKMDDLAKNKKGKKGGKKAKKMESESDFDASMNSDSETEFDDESVLTE